MAEIAEPLRFGAEEMRHDAAAMGHPSKTSLILPIAGAPHHAPRSDFCSVWSDRVKCGCGLLRKNIRMTALHRVFEDWGLPQALFQLALALPVFAAVEYASGDRVLPWGEVSLFLALAGVLCHGPPGR